MITWTQPTKNTATYTQPSKNLVTEEIAGTSTNTGTANPGTMADVSAFGVGSVTWLNVNNAKVSDSSYTTNSYDTGNFPPRFTRDLSIKIVKSDSSLGSTDKADTGTNWSSTESYFSYGGNTDLWGETWTANDINDSDFGVVIAIKNYGLGGILENASHYLKATNFGFAIPSGATINGILLEIQKKSTEAGNVITANINHIRITVYYTTANTPATYSCPTKNSATYSYPTKK